MTTINWSELIANNNTWQAWRGLACQDNGAIVFADDSFVYINDATAFGTGSAIDFRKSTNYGTAWAGISTPWTQVMSIVTCTADAAKYMVGGAANVINASGTNIYYNSTGTHVKSTALGIKDWRFIVTSSSGANTYAAATGAGLWVTTDFGVNWVADVVDLAHATDNWDSLAMTDEAYTFIAVIGGITRGVWKKVGVGAWSNITPAAGLGAAYYVGMNDDGSSIYAATAVGGGTSIYNTVDYGATWSPLTMAFTGVVTGMNVSSDGTKIILLCADKYFYSSNSGASWTQKTPSFLNGILTMATCRTSDDFTKIFIGTNYGQVYFSPDFGTTWSTLNPKTPTYNFQWTSIATDYNYTSIVAAINSTSTYQKSVDNFIYYSNDSGVTWFIARPAGAAPSPATPWRGVGISEVGDVMVAISNPGRVYYSINYGTTWAEHNVSQAADKIWASVSSVYGNKFLVAKNNGGLYLADASANTYSEKQPAGAVSKLWTCAEYAEDTLHMIAVCSFGRVYISSNSGTAWTETRPAGDLNFNWNTAALSSDGKHMIAGQSAGRVYLSHDTGVSWLETQPAGNINVEWISSYVSAYGDTLFISGYYVSSGTTLYKRYYSKDFGVTWESITTPGAILATEVNGNKNGIRLVTADGESLFKGDVINTKNASFLQDIII